MAAKRKINEELDLHEVFSAEPIIEDMLRRQEHLALSAAIRSGEDFDTDWFAMYQNWYRHLDVNGRIVRSGNKIRIQVIFKDEHETEAHCNRVFEVPKSVHPERLIARIIEMMSETYNLVRDEYGHNKEQRLEAESEARDQQRIQENEAKTEARAGQVGPGMKGFVDDMGHCVAWKVDARQEPGHIDMMEDSCRPRIITEYFRSSGGRTIADLYGLRPETNTVFFGADAKDFEDPEKIRLIVSCFSDIKPDTMVIAHVGDVRYRSRADDLVNWERFWDISMRKPRWEDAERNPPAARRLPRWMKDEESMFRWALKNVGDFGAELDDPDFKKIATTINWRGEMLERFSEYLDIANAAREKGSIGIYRKITLEDRRCLNDLKSLIGCIDTQEIGHYWSAKEEGAGSFGAPEMGFEVMLRGAVAFEGIDWEHGFTSFCFYPDQFEIAVRHNVNISLTGVEDHVIDPPLIVNSGIEKGYIHRSARPNPPMYGRYAVYRHYERPRPQDHLEMRTDDFEEAVDIADADESEYHWGKVYDTEASEPYPLVYDSSDQGLLFRLREFSAHLDDLLTGGGAKARSVSKKQLCSVESAIAFFDGEVEYVLSDGGSRLACAEGRILLNTEDSAAGSIWDRRKTVDARSELERVFALLRSRYD